jgi:hypothetical protein
MTSSTMRAIVDYAEDEHLDLDEPDFGTVYLVTIFDPTYGPGGYSILHDATLDTLDETLEAVGLTVLHAPDDDICGDYVVGPLVNKSHLSERIARPCKFHRWDV